MDFSLNDELIMLKDAVERFVREDYDFDSRRRLAGTELGYSDDNWRRFAEMGWLGAALPAAFGGSELGAKAMLVILQGLGRGLVLEPYLPTVVMGGELIARHGSGEQQAAILGALISGACKLSLAIAEPGGRYALNHVATRAAPAGGGYRLSGAKGLVLQAASADHLVVPARLEGGDRDPGGIALFLIGADGDGMSRRDYRTYDGMRASELILEEVEVDASAMIGGPGQGLELLEECMDRGIAGLCAEAVGSMEILFEMTLEHLKTRQQFGRALGQFQALQHRMAELYMSLENARSMAFAATLAFDQPDPAVRRREVAAAKLQINASARLIGAEAAQLHGAIAITDELPAAHYYKRLSAIESLFGNSEYHLGRFTAAASP